MVYILKNLWVVSNIICSIQNSLKWYISIIGSSCVDYLLRVPPQNNNMLGSDEGIFWLDMCFSSTDPAIWIFVIKTIQNLPLKMGGGGPPSYCRYMGAET
jgi:hypothetical protein